MHGKMSNTGYMNSTGEKQKVFGNIAEIRETEEFDTSHGYGGSDKLNNFGIIVEQYHKDMEDEEKRQKQIGKNVMVSPSQLPKIQANRIGESLNLGSSLMALKPGQQKPKIVNSVVKTQAQAYGTNQNDQDGQKQDMEKFGEDFEDPEEDGDLMNNIDDFEKKLENNKKKTKQVKSAKTTESKIKDQAEVLAQRESDKEWFLSFINDKKKQNGKQEIFQSPKGIIGNSMNKYASHGVVNISTGSDLRSIGNLVNYDRTPGRDSVISNGLLKKEAEHKVENSIKYSEKNHEISAYAGKGENQQIRVKDDFVKNLQTQLNQKNSSQEQVLTNQHVSTSGGKAIGSRDPCHSDPEHNVNIQRITKENEKETGKEPSASYNGKFQGKPVNKVKQKPIQPEQGQTMKNDKKPPLKGQRPLKNIAVLNKGEKGSVNMKIQQLKPKVQSHVQVNYPGKKTYTLRTSSPGTKETRETNFTHEDVLQVKNNREIIESLYRKISKCSMKRKQISKMK